MSVNAVHSAYYHSASWHSTETMEPQEGAGQPMPWLELWPEPPQQQQEQMGAGHWRQGTGRRDAGKCWVGCTVG